MPLREDASIEAPACSGSAATPVLLVEGPRVPKRERQELSGSRCLHLGPRKAYTTSARLASLSFLHQRVWSHNYSRTQPPIRFIPCRVLSSGDCVHCTTAPTMAAV